MKIKILLFLFFLLCTINLRAQTAQQLAEKREEIRRIFGEDFFKDIEEFDKRYQELMKELFDNGQGASGLLDDAVLDQLMQKMQPHDYLGEGDFKWVENEKEKVLLIKIKQDKDTPLSIEIEKGIIEISGTVTQKEESKQGSASSYSSFTSSFSRSFPVPEDVIEKSAKIGNKDGDITISFDKISIEKPLPPKKTKKII